MDTQRKILVAVDLLEGTQRVLETAYAIAAPLDARLIVLSVAEPPTLPATPLPLGVPYPPPSPEFDAARLQRHLGPELEELAKRSLFARAPTPEFIVTEGQPDTQIVRTAAKLNVDLIVMGTHGPSGLKRMLLGSVAEKVVREAGCGVLVVREKQHSSDWTVPEIEPLCTDCATTREEAGDVTVWCARHSEHHVRGHAYGYTHASDDAPHASNSSTGT